jgi:RNA polymerase sigma-70 factor (ECF subfamily)
MRLSELLKGIIGSTALIGKMKSDAELVNRVARGDRSAFLTLYDRHAARIYGLSQRMLVDPMASEEVTQDTFLRLWTRAATFNPQKGNLLAWLLTIARKLAIDRMRLESRRPFEAESIEEKGWDWLPDPSSTTEESRWRTIRFALSELPTAQRQAIELAYYQGLSQSQISEHLNVPLGTVKTRVRLGMEKLRVAFREPNLKEVNRSESGDDDVN